MPFQTNAGIRYYQFERLGDGVTQAVFTRRGGCSPDPWTTLNMGGTVGDDPGRVRENRNRALQALNRTPESVYDVWQVHGTKVAIAEAPRPTELPHLQADTILTNLPGITLLMRFADCVPILLHDPVKKGNWDCPCGLAGDGAGNRPDGSRSHANWFWFKPW